MCMNCQHHDRHTHEHHVPRDIPPFCPIFAYVIYMIDQYISIDLREKNHLLKRLSFKFLTLSDKTIEHWYIHFCTVIFFFMCENINWTFVYKKDSY